MLNAALALDRSQRAALARPLMEKAVESPTASSLAWATCATVRLLQDDREGHRNACKVLLARFRDTTNRATAYYTIAALAAAPCSPTQYHALLKLAQRASDTSPRWPYQVVLGAALYRTGQYRKAAHQLQQALKLPGGDQSFLALLFLAMAHHHLGEAREATTYLAKGVAASDRALTLVGEVRPVVGLHDLLRREAEALILGPTKNKSK